MTDYGDAIVAYYGSFWADPQTFEAVRVDVRADVIPPRLQVSDATARIDYARVRIGASDVLLPQSAEQTLRQISDYESRNRIEFTHCNQYAAESVISFDGETSGSSARVNRVELPAGLTLAIGLETPLDLEIAHVGDLISAKVQSNVKHKGVVIVPKGAQVLGRLRRLEKYTDESSYFVVGLEFSEPRESCPFLCGIAADHFTGRPRANREDAGFPPAGRRNCFRKGGGLRLAAALRMVWKTTHYSEEDTTSAHH